MHSLSADNSNAWQVVSSVAGAANRLVTFSFVLTVCSVTLIAAANSFYCLPAGSKDVLKDHTWATSMKHIVPTVTQADSTYDSWELLASDEQASSSTAAQGATEQTTNMSCLYSRLDKLMYLIWPSIPIKTLELLTHKFPKVMVNPQSRSCPEQADPNIAVDEASMQSVAPFWEQEMLQVCLFCDHLP